MVVDDTQPHTAFAPSWTKSKSSAKVRFENMRNVNLVQIDSEPLKLNSEKKKLYSDKTAIV